ncbi:MAG TPA: GTP 3',8-cyclase MoaA [Acidothermaceae bacterium]
MTSGSARPAAVVDTLGRPLRDLRVSVTDRCNMRCRYCMPREVFGPGFAFSPRQELLTFEEIADVVAAFARAGVRKVRLTGGEPLLRAGLPDLVAMVVEVPGVEDVALTTNGSLLARHAPKLRAAGLHRVTVSLDTLDPALFQELSDTEISLDAVLDGIAAATSAGFGPIKLNTVVRRGSNDSDVERVAEFAREHGHIVRFIEYMDVGGTNGWRLDEVVPSSEIVARLSARWPLEPVDPNYRGEVASRYRYLDGAGEIGVISSISQPFCGSCTRARLSAIGEVYTCLFGSHGADLRAVVRADSDDATRAAALDAAIARLWGARADRYSELRAAHTGSRSRRKVEMSHIGG